MSEFFRDISLSDFQNPTYCLKATTSTTHKYYYPIFQKIIFSTLKRLFFTKSIQKLVLNYRKLPCTLFNMVEVSQLLIFYLVHGVIIIKENGFWWLINCIIHYLLTIHHFQPFPHTLNNF